MQSNLLVGVSSAVAAVAVAGSANAVVVPTIVDNFSTSGSFSTAGTHYAGLTMPWSAGTQTGAGILGTRQLTAGDSGVQSAMTMNCGGGQLQVGLDSNAPGMGGDNQFWAQYTFTTAVDMTQAGKSNFLVKGSGSASGGGSYFDGFGTSTDWAYGIGVCLYNGLTLGGPDGATWTNRAYYQFNMNGTRSFSGFGGWFNFSRADMQQAIIGSGPADTATMQIAAGADDAATFNWADIDAIQVYQYSYSGSGSTPMGNWNYTATSFSFVPAPGAAALIGAAGLITGRRRKA